MTDTKSFPDADYQALLGRFAALGYDTAPFVKFVQTAEQIGQPGVWIAKDLYQKGNMGGLASYADR
jgi:hypothetical protein